MEFHNCLDCGRILINLQTIMNWPCKKGNTADCGLFWASTHIVINGPNLPKEFEKNFQQYARTLECK
jgi:hypothetical protein